MLNRISRLSYNQTILLIKTIMDDFEISERKKSISQWHNLGLNPGQRYY